MPHPYGGHHASLLGNGPNHSLLSEHSRILPPMSTVNGARMTPDRDMLRGTNQTIGGINDGLNMGPYKDGLMSHLSGLSSPNDVLPKSAHSSAFSHYGNGAVERPFHGYGVGPAGNMDKPPSSLNAPNLNGNNPLNGSIQNGTSGANNGNVPMSRPGIQLPSPHNKMASPHSQMSSSASQPAQPSTKQGTMNHKGKSAHMFFFF